MQYICDQGFVLMGSATLTCHDRHASSPKWSDRVPKCLCKCPLARKGGFRRDRGLSRKAKGLARPSDSACLAVEQFKPCHGLSAPENGARSPEKKLHPAGATVHFSCAPGYVLKGQANLKCVPGHPSHWSDPPPICRAGECAASHTTPARSGGCYGKDILCWEPELPWLCALRASLLSLRQVRLTWWYED